MFDVFPGSETLKRKQPQRDGLFASLTSRSLKTVEVEDEFSDETGKTALNNTLSVSPYSATNVSMPDPPVDPEAMVLNLLSMVEMPEKLVSTAEER